MPREVNQGRRGAAEGTPAGRARAASAGRAHPSPRTFPALDPSAAPPPAPFPRPQAALAGALALVAVLLAAVLPVTELRLVVPAALLLAALLVIRRARAGSPADAAAAAPPSRRSRSGRSSFAPRVPRAVRVDGDGLTFAGAVPQPLLDLSAPFGVTLLASPRRDRVVALLSSTAGTYALGAELDAAARVASASLLDRALTVAADDSVLAAIGPDGEPLLFSAADLSAIVAGLVDESPACLDRFVLTDARGAALTLDGLELAVGDRAVDLTAPLEWRSIVFQEAFGQAVAVYQGTWVRQGGTELVLVCLLSQLGPPPGADLDRSQLDHHVLRDLRLMAASPTSPPPREQRVAIERPFMLPVRYALDRAPRPSQQPDRAQA
jgi:hypothetical protein